MRLCIYSSGYRESDEFRMYEKRESLKSDHRMNRCFLAGLYGDAINAVLAAAGANLRKLLGLYRRKVGRFVFALCDTAKRLVFAMTWCLENPIAAPPERRSLHYAAA